jgi:hypothetical protein
MILPAASLPTDNPQVEIVTYQASTSGRLVGVVSWEMIDLAVQVSYTVKFNSETGSQYSSIARNGPKSPPVVLTTPTKV